MRCCIPWLNYTRLSEYCKGFLQYALWSAALRSLRAGAACSAYTPRMPYYSLIKRHRINIQHHDAGVTASSRTGTATRQDLDDAIDLSLFRVPRPAAEDIARTTALLRDLRAALAADDDAAMAEIRNCGW